MKRIMSPILATAIVLTAQTNIFALAEDIDFAIVGNTLSVSGNAGSENNNEVLFRVIKKRSSFDIAKDVVYIEQKATGEKGDFSFVCDLPDNSQSAEELSDFTSEAYVFSIGVIGDTSDLKSEVIDFYGDDYQSKAIALLNGAKSEFKSDQAKAAASAENILDETYNKLYIGAKKFESLKTADNYKKIISYFLKLPDVGNTADIREQLEEAAAITVLNMNSNDIDKIREMVEREDGQISLGIYSSTALESYFDFKPICGEQILSAYANSSISNISESKNNFEFSVISNALKQSTTAYQVKLLIEKNKEILGVKDPKYQLTDTEYGKLTGTTVNSLSDVKKLIENIISSRGKSSQGGSSGNKGNGGNGGGGYSSVVISNENSISTPAQTSPAVSPFNDISDFGWAKDSIEYLFTKGIVNGKGNNRFAPRDNVTREEFLKMILLSFGIGKDDVTKSNFSDVESGSWYEGYVNEACKRGIVRGLTENIFGVNTSIKREDAAVIVYRTLEDLDLLDVTVEYKSGFADNDAISDYAEKAVSYMQEKEMLKGYEDGTFKPAGKITRAESAVVIKRVIDYVYRIYKGGIDL